MWSKAAARMAAAAYCSSLSGSHMVHHGTRRAAGIHVLESAAGLAEPDGLESAAGPARGMLKPVAVTSDTRIAVIQWRLTPHALTTPHSR